MAAVDKTVVEEIQYGFCIRTPPMFTKVKRMMSFSRRVDLYPSVVFPSIFDPYLIPIHINLSLESDSYIVVFILVGIIN